MQIALKIYFFDYIYYIHYIPELISLNRENVKYLIFVLKVIIDLQFQHNYPIRSSCYVISTRKKQGGDVLNRSELKTHYLLIKRTFQTIPVCNWNQKKNIFLDGFFFSFYIEQIHEEIY